MNINVNYSAFHIRDARSLRFEYLPSTFLTRQAPCIEHRKTQDSKGAQDTTYVGAVLPSAMLPS